MMHRKHPEGDMQLRMDQTKHKDQDSSKVTGRLTSIPDKEDLPM